MQNRRLNEMDTHQQGRIKTALGPGAMTYCRAPHHSDDIYIYIYIYIYMG